MSRLSRSFFYYKRAHENRINKELAVFDICLYILTMPIFFVKMTIFLWKEKTSKKISCSITKRVSCWQRCSCYLWKLFSCNRKCSVHMYSLWLISCYSNDLFFFLAVELLRCLHFFQWCCDVFCKCAQERTLLCLLSWWHAVNFSDCYVYIIFMNLV